LAFGALLFIAGTLIVANAWGVIDAKFATLSAARDGAATYAEVGTEADGARPPSERATTAALESLRRQGAVDIRLGDGGYRRCGRVTVTVVTDVPVIRIPFVGGTGGKIAVSGSSSRVIDPFRSSVAGEAVC
jgi:hypothetical protein